MFTARDRRPGRPRVCEGLMIRFGVKFWAKRPSQWSASGDSRVEMARDACSFPSLQKREREVWTDRAWINRRCFVVSWIVERGRGSNGSDKPSRSHSRAGFILLGGGSIRLGFFSFSLVLSDKNPRRFCTSSGSTRQTTLAVGIWCGTCRCFPPIPSPSWRRSTSARSWHEHRSSPSWKWFPENDLANGTSDTFAFNSARACARSRSRLLDQTYATLNFYRGLIILLLLTQKLVVIRKSSACGERIAAFLASLFMTLTFRKEGNAKHDSNTLTEFLSIPQGGS